MLVKVLSINSLHSLENNSILGKSEDLLMDHHPQTNILDEIIITPQKIDSQPNQQTGAQPRSLVTFFDDSGEESNQRSSRFYTDPNNRSPNIDSLKSQITLSNPEPRKVKKKPCCRRKNNKKQGNITLMGDQIIMRKTGQKFRDSKSAAGNKLLNVIAKIAVTGRNRSIRQIFRKALVNLKVNFNVIVVQEPRNARQGQKDLYA